MAIYYAHSGNDYKKWHLLKEHLISVSRLAGEYLADWKGEEEAKLAGLLHDLGKYGDRFQNRLHGQDKGLDHWSQGAFLAIKRAVQSQRPLPYKAIILACKVYKQRI